MGAVCHTVNPRLFAEQIEYIVNHAQDWVIFLDPLFVPLLEKLQAKLSATEKYVVLCDESHMPETTLKGAVSYESFIAGQGDIFDWPELDENAACSLCYTSGTTGNPKGVLYSHRSTILHSYAAIMPDTMGLSRNDCILPIVPMFHVNAWGIPYAAVMVGAKLVLPGPKMADGETLQALIESENVSLSAGVPTVWLALLDYLDQTAKKVDCLKRVIVGGAACPWSIMERFEQNYQVDVHHAWGMTETSPLGVFNAMTKENAGDITNEEFKATKLKQGRPIFGVDMKIVDDNNQALPWDGKAFGELMIRGSWVRSQYFGQDNEAVDEWFATGDVATIDQDAYMQITDRTKDVIKSGGEWISSIELENIAVNHPLVVEAAVIGVASKQWTERPLLVVVKKEGAQLATQDMLAWFSGKVAKWWEPQDVAFVDQLPHTATGKISKKDLREQFKDIELD